jgi:hypothetical protein
MRLAQKNMIRNGRDSIDDYLRKEERGD